MTGDAEASNDSPNQMHYRLQGKFPEVNRPRSCQTVTGCNAEHRGANLLPRNAAVRLQARTTDRRFQSGKRMMAKVIKFYIPNRFQKKVAWVPPEERGKVIEFRVQVKKSA